MSAFSMRFHVLFAHKTLAVLALLRYNELMATIMIRDLDDKVKRSLQIRAATNGRSMEAEARAILTTIVNYLPTAEMPVAKAVAKPSAPKKKLGTARAKAKRRP
jgi:plasmid stability protein